ncbi:glycosyl transferase family 28 [Chitinophaga caeni]|uniref:Glycosyl transferase family 28 n=1 Tax=Chitinophaga caeni TaxID=2029983 RepID=A0A291QRX5_9BACT|nr:glycosyltransferase [Chitinophaga caeni]ATL46661.1 glycosyl transferase family 28 [Chitinophaga caeni]
MSTSPQVPKKILIVPLDWGLGHATRDIPLIYELLNAGCEVIIAAEGKHAALLHQEFPGLTMLPLPGYRIQYAQKGLFFGPKIIQQIPKIYKSVTYENNWLREIVKEYKIDAVISDNRFGLHHPGIKSVFISHQLLIKTPFGKPVENWLQSINYSYINKYDECWVPDFQGDNNLSGELGHPKKLPEHTKYLGCLSRFEPIPGIEKKYDVLALISGPEPQRSNLESMILEQIKSLPIKALIVSGLPGQPFKNEIAPGIIHVNHLDSKSLNEAMIASDLVISRTGYTTLMDLAKLDKKSVLIPTPGQSEQEYLGDYFMKKGYSYCIPQQKFILAEALKAAATFPFKSYKDNGDMYAYKAVVKEFVDSLQQEKKQVQA